MLISFLTLSWNTFSQTATTRPLATIKTDTTKICLPSQTLREAAKDLIRYDECKFEVKLLNQKIQKLEQKDTIRIIMYDLVQEKNINLEYIIKQKDAQIEEYKGLTTDLKKEVKSKRFSSWIWRATSMLFIGTTVYFAVK
jgi:hypothetical protein